MEKALKKLLNWKAPGPDKLQNYWLKTFSSVHKHLAKCFQKILEHPNSMPEFMTRGVTYLMPKTDQFSEDPSKYRPITCLPTLYKVLTSIISEKIYKHLQLNNLLDEEQKGCRRGSRGCKEQLVIDAVITKTAVQRKQSLFTAYIDYQKAFDSVPHSWLMEVLSLYGVEKQVREFLAQAMKSWTTELCLNAPGFQLRAGTIYIKRGIFQGDSLSPLWFCLALKPLTSMLNNLKLGYVLRKGFQISHLWYVDDLKVFSSTKEYLHRLLGTVSAFSNDIEMKFGLDKCKICSMLKGVWAENEGYEIDEQQGRIEGMLENEKYKYLGYMQALGIDHKASKQRVTDAYKMRLRAILKSELSGRNTAFAVNTYATSLLTYSFGILNWTETELNALDIATRQEFRKCRAHHPRSSIHRFHLPRAEGGRGIPSVTRRHHQQIENLRKYFLEKAEHSKMHQEIVKADEKITPLKLADATYNPMTALPTIPQIKEEWKNKPLHGHYPTRIEKDEIDTRASQSWLHSGGLFVETEGFIAAIHDQVIHTKSYRKRIMKKKVENVMCRMCGEKEESLDHLISGCSVLAPKQYLERHNSVAGIIHQELAKKYMGEEDLGPYYNYNPPPIKENEDCRLYWDRKIRTHRTTPNNVPDLVLTLKRKKISYIIDIAVPLAKNTQDTFSEKINKYMPLADEIKKVWKLDKVVIVPVVLGATGEIPKKLFQSIETLQLNKTIYQQLQKAALLGTCRTVRRVLGDKVMSN